MKQKQANHIKKRRDKESGEKGIALWMDQTTKFFFSGAAKGILGR